MLTIAVVKSVIKYIVAVAKVTLAPVLLYYFYLNFNIGNLAEKLKQHV